MTSHTISFPYVHGGKWEEATLDDLGNGAKIVSVASQFALSESATGTVEGHYVMAYLTNGLCHYQGLYKFTGTFGGKTGSFVASTKGVHDSNGAKDHFTILDGSGSGELAGISGTGDLVGSKAEGAKITLNYTL